MSDNSGFKVIKAPAKHGVGRSGTFYKDLAEKLRSLPDGEAIEVERTQASIYSSLRDFGIRACIHKISDGVFAVWERRAKG